MIISADGWLDVATKFLPSPFYNDRPLGTKINTCVLHNISLPPNCWGEKYVEALFSGNLPNFRNDHLFLEKIAHLEVSAHFFISRDGKITQFVSTENRAWHAGVSEFCGQTGCNDFSIGIEINGADHLPYTLKQYQTTAKLVVALCERYPEIRDNRITTHSAIAPGRKTDPGPAFNLAYFLRLFHTCKNNQKY